MAARYTDELKRRIASSTGVDAHLDDAAFVAAVRSFDSGERADRLQALLERTGRLQTGDPDENELLRAARDVDDSERQWSQAAELRP